MNSTEEKFKLHLESSCLRKFSPMYFTVGLVEEVAELFQELSRDLVDNDAVVLETGDVLWYVYGLCRELGDVHPLLYRSLNVNEEYNKNDLLVLVGTLAGSIKKMSRGDKPEAEFLPRIQENINCLMHAVDGLCGVSSLEDCMEKNIEKINKRKEKGTLKGDGSNR